MGNQITFEDMNAPGYVDKGLFTITSSFEHPLFGLIKVLKLAGKPKSLNTNNPLIQTANEKQQYMSLDTPLPQMVLVQLIIAMIKLQKTTKETLLNLVERGHSAQSTIGYKGIIFEYEPRTLGQELQIRKAKSLSFSQSELNYILTTIVKTYQQMIEIPFLDHIINHTTISLDSIFVNESGKIKIGNCPAYLAKQNLDQSCLDQENVYEKLIKQVKQKNSQQQMLDESSLACGIADEKTDEKVNLMDPKIQKTIRKSVCQIGQFMYYLTNSNLSQNYQSLIQAMVETNEQKGLLYNDILYVLQEDSFKNQTVTCLNVRYEQTSSQVIKEEKVQSVNQSVSMHNEQQNQKDLQTLKYLTLNPNQNPNVNINEPNLNFSQNKILEQDFQFVDKSINQAKPIAVINKQRIINSISPAKEQKAQKVLKLDKLANINVKITPLIEPTTQYYQVPIPIYAPPPVVPAQTVGSTYFVQPMELYEPNRKIDERVKMALNNSERVMQDFALKVGSSGIYNRQYYQSSMVQNQSRFVPVTTTYQNSDFDNRFWNVIREAKQQVLKSEAGNYIDKQY